MAPTPARPWLLGAKEWPGRRFSERAKRLLKVVLHSIQGGLGALFILVRRTAAHADPTDLDLVRGHDRQPASEGNDTRDIGNPWHHPGFALLSERQFPEESSWEREVCGCHSL